MKYTAIKDDLRREIRALRRVGQQLSNIAYNYGQGSGPTTLDTRAKQGLMKLVDEWDSVKRSESDE